jgi:alkanesulfonate monooxygenase SsuD/methylene tetrahydromethanopterin reductase-like flavin-dependent oxidoreductase (luciferase family)
MFCAPSSVYDSLFAEKLDLLLKIRETTHVYWSGKHRAALTGQGVYPRPVQNPLPIRIGVGGTPHSFARAGALGIPLVVAIIGGEPRRFRPLIDLYRDAGRRAGHPPEALNVSIHSIGFLADTTEQAANEFYLRTRNSSIESEKSEGGRPSPQHSSTPHVNRPARCSWADPDSIAEKIISENEALGGISRMTILLNGGMIPHAKTMHAIELLGTQVAPIVKKELVAVTA